MSAEDDRRRRRTEQQRLRRMKQRSQNSKVEAKNHDKWAKARAAKERRHQLEEEGKVVSFPGKRANKAEQVGEPAKRVVQQVREVRQSEGAERFDNDQRRSRGKTRQFANRIYVEDFIENWIDNGADTIERMRLMDPVAYVTAMGRLMPKEIDIRDQSRQTEEQLLERISTLAARFAEALAGVTGPVIEGTAVRSARDARAARAIANNPGPEQA